MRRLIVTLAALAAIGFAIFWFVTRPNPLPADALARFSGYGQRQPPTDTAHD